MPPAAAFECDLTGWTLDMIATVAPARAAARAALWPAKPAPMINTSWTGIAAPYTAILKEGPVRGATPCQSGVPSGTLWAERDARYEGCRRACRARDTWSIV